jgi:hypothetical protein
MSDRRIEWDVAEVIDYDYTYRYIPGDQTNPTTDKLFALKVRSCSTYYNDKLILARPSNINMKQIPLVGEFVLIYKTFNQQATSDQWREGWYYVASIDIQSSINSNMLPGLSDGARQESIDETKPGKTFNQKSISPLQPYEGDFLLEGRWGNSIRFSNTISTSYPDGYYYKAPTWLTPGGQNTNDVLQSDPIIILSNGRINKQGKEFVVENIEQDAASLYLTSTQQLNDLKITKPLTVHNSFNGSQFVGIADRIILRAKRDLAVIDSELGIVLNTPNNIYIGGEKASQPLVHGDVLMEILSKILDHLQFVPIQCGELTGGFLSKTQLNSARRKLDDLVSSKYRMEFNPRK